VKKGSESNATIKALLPTDRDRVVVRITAGFVPRRPQKVKKFRPTWTTIKPGRSAPFRRQKTAKYYQGVIEERRRKSKFKR
jgi:hypothetical protein